MLNRLDQIYIRIIYIYYEAGRVTPRFHFKKMLDKVNQNLYITRLPLGNDPGQPKGKTIFEKEKKRARVQGECTEQNNEFLSKENDSKQPFGNQILNFFNWRV